MTYKDLGFRILYHCFVAIKLTDDLRPLIRDFYGEDKADGMLLYGYIDHEAGFTFAILGAGWFTDNGGFTISFTSCSGNDNIHSFIRAERIAEYELFNMNDNAEMLGAQYAKKLEMLNAYDEPIEMADTRYMEYIDHLRDSIYVDDIQVILVKDGLKPEQVYVRLESIVDTDITGTLLNEPYQDFGFHENDKIPVFLDKDKKGRVIAFTVFE